MTENNFTPVKFEINSFLPDIQQPKIKQKPADKRSHMIDRKHAPHQVLCYVCCSEFGTSSLSIHQKTCLKKHQWSIEAIVNEPGVSKKQAMRNRRNCCDPGSGPEQPLPAADSPHEVFEEYNKQALRVFMEHAEHCLVCRTRDNEAMEAARRKEEELRRREEDAMNARRKQEEEENKRKQAEEDEKRRREEAEARKRAAENEWARIQNDLARRRAAADDLKRQQQEEEARKAAEEAEEEERRRRQLALGKKKFLRKGEGHQAASEAIKTQQEKELEAKAKRDIAQYSLNHAVKEGLVRNRPQSATSTEVADIRYAEVDEGHIQGSWDAQWTPEQEVEFSAMQAALTEVKDS